MVAHRDCIAGGRRVLRSIDAQLILAWLGSVLVTAFVTQYVLPMYFIPLVGLFTLFFWPFPTLLAYFTFFLLIYFAAQLAVTPARRSAVARRWIAAALALAVTAAAAWLVPAAANEAMEKRVAALLAQEKRAALQPTATIALVELNGLFAMEPECSEACIVLLRSGYAQTILVASEHTNALAPSARLMARRYRLVGDQATCVLESEGWNRGFAGRPRREAMAEGDFDEAFQRQFGGCVTDLGRAPLKADLVFLDASPMSQSGREILGIDWSLAQLSVQSVRRLIDHRSAPSKELMRQTTFGALRLSRPLHVIPISGSGMSPGPGGGHWAGTEFAPRDSEATFWSLITNGEEIYQRATSPAPPRTAQGSEKLPSAGSPASSPAGRPVRRSP